MRANWIARGVLATVLLGVAGCDDPERPATGPVSSDEKPS